MTSRGALPKGDGAGEPSGCRRILPLLEPYQDGELSPETTVEVEQHLEDCRRCSAQARFGAAFKLSVRNEVRAAAPGLSADFEERVRAALAAERSRARKHSQQDVQQKQLPWRAVLPLAAAAAATLVWASSSSRDLHAPNAVGSADVMGPGGMTRAVESLIDEFVDHHAQATGKAPEFVDTRALQRFEPQVGVPVQVPSLQQFGARWEGGGLVPLTVGSEVKSPDRPSRSAAVLRYRVNGHRLTVYVYDAARVPLRATLYPRVVDNVPVFVGTRRGYTIAAAEKPNGVGYAATSDLNDAETARLVATVLH
jgi:anti-sigma factor RsiW